MPRKKKSIKTHIKAKLNKTIRQMKIREYCENNIILKWIKFECHLSKIYLNSGCIYSKNPQSIFWKFTVIIPHQKFTFYLILQFVLWKTYFFSTFYFNINKRNNFYIYKFYTCFIDSEILITELKSIWRFYPAKISNQRYILQMYKWTHEHALNVE